MEEYDANHKIIEDCLIEHSTNMEYMPLIDYIMMDEMKKQRYNICEALYESKAYVSGSFILD